MKAFAAFCKKEILESIRTYKGIVMLAAFAVFGILSPLLAKMIPDLLNGTDMGGGVVISMPAATAMDAWGQFFKNIGQMGVLVLVIVFCGIMANELSKGTLVNILSKGMRRGTVIWAKFTVAGALWTVSYALSFAVCLGYTVYLWGGGALPHLWLAVAGPWVYGLLLIALLSLGGILFKSIVGSLVLAGGLLVVMSLVAIAPQTQRFNPMALGGDAVGLLAGQTAAAEVWPALVVTIGLTAVILAGSLWLFHRKAL
ncbi:MAG: ABC transporter permease [Oscillospiraceae bacterium]|nr:ABC transporter permease [Oscillospiraceae bacterium]